MTVPDALFSNEDLNQFANSQLNASIFIMSLTPTQQRELEGKAFAAFGEGPDAEEATALYITWASARGVI